MSTYTLPTTAPFKAARFELSPGSANTFTATSPLSGDVQSVVLPGDRRRARLVFPYAYAAERAQLEGFIEKLRPSQNGISVHWLRMHHLARPAPRGTLRGAPTVNAVANALATQVQIASGTNGWTLLRGDLIGFPNQTVMVTDDATVSGGAITVNTSPLRYALAVGHAVTWDKPPFTWAIVGLPMLPYEPGGLSGEVTVELMEVW